MLISPETCPNDLAHTAFSPAVTLITDNVFGGTGKTTPSEDVADGCVFEI